MRSQPGTPLQPMSSRTSSERISQPWLTLARSVWVVCALLLLANFVASIPAYYQLLQTICTLPDPSNCATGLRTQFTHCIDIGPMILDIAGIAQPKHVDGIEQQPMHAVSFADSLTDANAPERHTQQYFEIAGYRAMYKDGWWLATLLPRIPWDLTPATMKRFAPDVYDPDKDPVELYYLPDDFSQAHNVAAQYPEKVKELQALFWEEAEKYLVTPLLGALSFYFGMIPPLPTQTKYTYNGDVQHVASGMIPRIYNHSYAISADLVIPEGGAEGVIVAEADHLGGFSLFVQDGKLKHTYSTMGVFVYTQEATEPLPSGNVNVRLEFAADAPQPATGDR